MKAKDLLIIFLGVLIVLWWTVFSVNAASPQRVKVASPQLLTSADLATRWVQRCSWFDRGSHYLIHDECFQKWTLPQLSVQQAWDSLTQQIEDVTDTYAIDENQFTYDWTELLYTDEFHALQWEWNSWELFKNSDQWNWYKMIPTSILAWLQSQDRSFYASVRDTSTYWTCRKTNYNVAMEQLNWYVLQPWELLNMNKEIAYKPGYCTWWSHFMFYQWACWWSTQFFWNGLINPYLEVTKRYSHGQRYAWFYGSTVLWDDASMYEMWKQAEIKNSWEHPIYFWTVVRPSDTNTVLISMYPESTWLTTMIQKQQTWVRSAVLTNTIFDEAWSVVYEKDRISHYRWINTETDSD